MQSNHVITQFKKPALHHQYLCLPNMPLDVLIWIFKHVLPEWLGKLQLVNQDFYFLIHFKFDSIWERKRKIHFPEEPVNLKMTTYQQFVNGYKNKYVNILHLAPFYSMINEREAELFKSRILKKPKDYFFVEKNNNQSLWKKANDSKQQTMLDTMYIAVKQEFAKSKTKKLEDTWMTALGNALICKQPLNEIQDLLAKGSSYTETYENEIRPIHIIAEFHQFKEVLQHLLEFFPEHLNLKNGNGFSPIMLASQHGNHEIVELLLQQEGIDISTEVSNIFDYVMSSNSVKCLEAIINFNKIKQVVALDDIYKTFQRIFINNRRVNFQIMQACLNGYPELLNYKDGAGQGIFMWACYKNKIKLVDFFLEKMDSEMLFRRTVDKFEGYDSTNMSALDFAILKSHQQVIWILLQAFTTKKFADGNEDLISLTLIQAYCYAKDKNKFGSALLLLQTHPHLANNNDVVDQSLQAYLASPDQGLLAAFDIADAKKRNALIEAFTKGYIASLPISKEEKDKLQIAFQKLNDYMSDEANYTNTIFYNSSADKKYVAKTLRNLLVANYDHQDFEQKLKTFMDDKRVKNLTGTLLNIYMSFEWYLNRRLQSSTYNDSITRLALTPMKSWK